MAALAGALADKNVDVRSAAAYALGELGPKATSAVTALKDALKDDDADVRQSAAQALAEIGPDAKGAVAALASALRDADPGVRAAAATALGEIGPDAAGAVGSLTDAVKDPKVEVREAAITALAEMGPAAQLGNVGPDAGTERRRCRRSPSGGHGAWPDRTRRQRLTRLGALLESGLDSIPPPLAGFDFGTGIGNPGELWQALAALAVRIDWLVPMPEVSPDSGALHP